jgi:hypothetical protein
MVTRRTRSPPLELLAGCGHQRCSEHVLRAHGFTTEQLVDLVRVGLATATPQRVRAGGKAIEVATLRITAEGANGAGADEVMIERGPIDQSTTLA